MGIFKPLRKIVSFVENPDIPFLYYVLLFFSVVTLRNFLEIFSDTAKLPFKLLSPQQFIYFSVWQGLCISFLHYYVFWTSLILAVGIVFFIITREGIAKILRVVMAFSSILVVTPLFDLMITGGKGLDIAYAYPKNIAEFLWILSTPGMKFTCCLALLLSFIYAQIKTESFLKGLGASLGLYLLLLFGSVLPIILKVSHPIPIIRILLLIIFMELLVISYLKNKGSFLALVKDIRLPRAIHFELMFILGICLTQQSFLKIVGQNIDSFCLTSISIFLAWIAAIMFNNLEDYHIDRISNPNRPLVLAAISHSDYQRIALSIVVGAAIFGLGVNFQTFFFMLLLIGNSFIYSLPPLKAKRIPIFSKIFIAFNSLILVMLGYIFAGRELLEFPSVIIGYFLIFVTLTMNFIDLKDYAGDKQAGIVTLPVMLGLKRAKLIIGGLFLISYCLLSWVFLEPYLFIPALILGGLQFFLINRKHYQEKWILLTYLASLLLLLLYLSAP